MPDFSQSPHLAGWPGRTAHGHLAAIPATLGRVALVSAIMAWLVIVSPLVAQGGGDQVVFARFDGISQTPLPGGPHGPSTPSALEPVAMAAESDGTLYVINPRLVGNNYVYEYHTRDPAGTETFVNMLPIGLQLDILDLTLGPDGDLYLLTLASHPIQGLFVNNLFRIDRHNGLLLAAFDLATDRLQALAPAPRGALWALRDDELLKLDPTLGTLAPTGISLPASFQTLAADTDSGGALWLVQEALIVSPPFYRLARLDPVTGTLRAASFDLGFQPRAMAIRRGCEETATARCLLGGRFRATVTWRDFQNRTGAGRVAPRGSADSALFWFFDPANFEILVKMVEGCEENGHYWVFAAGTTDVEHLLEVTDLATGEIFLAANPLGQASSAVTAVTAFATCP